MKNNKLIKFGIVLVSVATLGTVAPALTNNPIFGITVVKAEEQQESAIYRISYYDRNTGEEIAPKMTGVLKPGESVNIYKDIDGYRVVTRPDWMPGYNLTRDIVITYFYGSNGYNDGYLEYEKVEPTPNPEPAPTPTPDPGQGQDQNPTPNPVPTPDPGQGQDQNPTPNPVPTPDPAKPGQDQKDPGKPDKPQLPETGEKGSTFGALLGLLTAPLAWFVLRKKS